MCPNFMRRQLVCKKCASLLVLLHSPSENCQIFIHVWWLSVEDRRIEKRLVTWLVTECYVMLSGLTCATPRWRSCSPTGPATATARYAPSSTTTSSNRPFTRSSAGTGSTFDVFFSSFSHLNLMCMCSQQATARCRRDCSCEQKYKWHRLLAYDPNNDCAGVFMDWFLFPSCCSCRSDTAVHAFYLSNIALWLFRCHNNPFRG